MSNQEQIEKLRQMADLLYKKWRELNFRTALFQCAFRDKKLINRINSQKLAHGFEALRIALSESVVICAAGLLKGNNKKELCFNNIIPHFKDASAPCYRNIRLEFVSALVDDDDEDAMNKVFEKSAEALVRKYQSLVKSRAYKHLISIRDKSFAHFELRALAENRRLLTPTDFPITYAEIDRVVSKIGELICDCLYLLTCTTMITSIYTRENRNAASEFWNKAFPRVRNIRM